MFASFCYCIITKITEFIPSTFENHFAWILNYHFISINMVFIFLPTVCRIHRINVETSNTVLKISNHLSCQTTHAIEYNFFNGFGQSQSPRALRVDKSDDGVSWTTEWDQGDIGTWTTTAGQTKRYDIPS